MGAKIPSMDYRQHRAACRLVHECCNYDILFRGDGVVDVAKTQCFRILAAKLKDPIRPDAADGDDVLYRSRNRKSFFVLLQCILQSFNQV